MLAVGNDLRPNRGIQQRRTKKGKVPTTLQIASNPPRFLVVARRILQAVLARAQAGKCSQRLRRLKVPNLVRIGCGGRYHEVVLGLPAVDRAAEGLVGLMKYQNRRLRRPECLPPDLIDPQGLGILGGIKERLPVVGPSEGA
jgi:hypothetical protein